MPANKPRNGLIQALFFALFGVLITLLGWNFKTLSQDVKNVHKTAAINTTELARRESDTKKIPAIETAVNEIKREQAVQGKVLEAIAENVEKLAAE